MKKIFNILPQIAKSDSTVLIEGETGTGKELMARANHDSSTVQVHLDLFRSLVSPVFYLIYQ